MATKVAKPKYLVIENLTGGQVGLPHPEGLSEPGLALLPYESRAVKPEVWEDSPELRRFVERGLLRTTLADKRPSPPPKMPPEVEPVTPNDKETAYQIAFKPDSQGIVQELINVDPEMVKNPIDRHPGLNVKFLRERHKPTLIAAKWYLERYNLPWSAERIKQINARIAHIDGL